MKAFKRGYFDVLHEAAKAVNSSLSSEQVLETVVRVATIATGAKGCSLMLLDDTLTHLVHTATYGLSDQFLSKGAISADRIMAETTGGKPIVVSDVSNDPRIQYPQETMEEGVFSELSVPLYLRDRITGVIRIYSSKKQEFSADVIKLLSAIADLSAIAIENARMHESLKKAHDVCLTELGYWQP